MPDLPDKKNPAKKKKATPEPHVTMFETPGDSGGAGTSSQAEEVTTLAEVFGTPANPRSPESLTCDTCGKPFLDNQNVVYALRHLFCGGFCRYIGPRRPDGTTGW